MSARRIYLDYNASTPVEKFLGPPEIEGIVTRSDNR